MKLSGQAALRYFARPEPDRAGVLIYGADAMRVALRRQEMLAALLGPGAEEEMRLTRLPAASLKADPAAAHDAMKAVGFFPGPRAVFVEDAGDAHAGPLSQALAGHAPGDAQIVATAKALGKSSALRKAFEAHPAAFAIAVYDDPMGRPELEAALAAAGVTASAQAMADLSALALALEPGDMRQMIAKLGLYMLGTDAAAGPADIAAVAPLTVEAETDAVLHAAAEGQSGRIGPLVARLSGQGTQAVGLCIAAARHFRALHAAKIHPKGPGAGLAAQRPPVFGPRRDRMQAQVRMWRLDRLERGLRLLTETDLTLRSATPVPGMALMERTLVRLSMMADRKR